MPRTAKKESQRPMSQTAGGEIKRMRKSAKKREVIASLSLLSRKDVYTKLVMIKARTVEEEKPVSAT